jgi:hypothetical protein
MTGTTAAAGLHSDAKLTSGAAGTGGYGTLPYGCPVRVCSGLGHPAAVLCASYLTRKKERHQRLHAAA